MKTTVVLLVSMLGLVVSKPTPERQARFLGPMLQKLNEEMQKSVQKMEELENHRNNKKIQAQLNKMGGDFGDMLGSQFENWGKELGNMGGNFGDQFKQLGNMGGNFGDQFKQLGNMGGNLEDQFKQLGDQFDKLSDQYKGTDLGGNMDGLGDMFKDLGNDMKDLQNSMGGGGNPFGNMDLSGFGDKFDNPGFTGGYGGSDMFDSNGFGGIDGSNGFGGSDMFGSNGFGGSDMFGSKGVGGSGMFGSNGFGFKKRR